MSVAAKPAAEATLQSAMEADKAFVADIKKNGLQAAFLAWFEPEGSQFIDRGSMLIGTANIAAPFAQTPPGFMIDWTPGWRPCLPTRRFRHHHRPLHRENGRPADRRRPLRDQLEEERRRRMEGRARRHHRRSASRWRPCPLAPDPNGRPG